jgi:hypothetical protein
MPDRDERLLEEPPRELRGRERADERDDRRAELAGRGQPGSGPEDRAVHEAEQRDVDEVRMIPPMRKPESTKNRSTPLDESDRSGALHRPSGTMFTV